MIEVFTTNTCAACKSVKKLLDYKKLPFIERNIDADPSLLEKIVSFGYTTVPVTVFSDGGEVTRVVAGYSPQQLLG